MYRFVKEGIMIRKLLGIGLVLCLAAGLVFAAGAREEPARQLLIWSAAAEDEAEALIEAFRAHYPDITVNMIRAGSGELLTRLQAEQPRPQGDILLGIAKEAYDANYDLFTGHKVVNHDEIPADVRDTADPPRYYGYSMPLQAIMVNTQLLSEADIPRSWADLADPKYRGEIILANPATSGSAYAQLYMMYNLYGFDFLPGVVANTVYTASSTAVPESVARGEYAIGVTGEANIAMYIEQGAPVTYVYPEEGTGARFDASGIIKGGPNLETAKLFMDFVTTLEAYEIIYTTRSRRVVHPALPGPGPLPGLSDIKLFEYDAAEAAAMREELTNRFLDLIQ